MTGTGLNVIFFSFFGGTIVEKFVLTRESSAVTLFIFSVVVGKAKKTKKQKIKNPPPKKNTTHIYAFRCSALLKESGGGGGGCDWFYNRLIDVFTRESRVLTTHLDHFCLTVW